MAGSRGARGVQLWALLNFLMPHVFASADEFDEWFDLDVDDAAAKTRMITQLHKILRPFMLRRLKADVERTLPGKVESRSHPLGLFSARRLRRDCS